MIKVTAKTQNAAALGVMYAYVQLNPGVSLEELRSTFPNNIAPDKGVNELFLPLEDAVAYNTQSNMSLDSDALFVWLCKYLNISVLRIFSLLHCE